MTFLAILELAKIQALQLFQNVGAGGMPTGPVRVRTAVDTAPDASQIEAAGEEVERAWAADRARARKGASTGGSPVESEEE